MRNSSPWVIPQTDHWRWSQGFHECPLCLKKVVSWGFLKLSTDFRLSFFRCSKKQKVFSNRSPLNPLNGRCLISTMFTLIPTAPLIESTRGLRYLSPHRALHYTDRYFQCTKRRSSPNNWFIQGVNFCLFISKISSKHNRHYISCSVGIIHYENLYSHAGRSIWYRCISLSISTRRIQEEHFWTIPHRGLLETNDIIHIDLN